MSATLRVFAIILLFFCVTCFARERIVVVANVKNTALKLSRQEVRNLFMGGASEYALTAIALPPENLTRVLFNTRVVGLTESRIQSYWAQMKFSGRRQQPKELQSEQSVLDYVKNNHNAVGYLSSAMEIPNELTILFEIK
ncbi:hypothetical protein [Cognaticolwellia aestuarii]|uniref:hypothetical protein n=1 Tax=Cognaticolwellia aestuarii TaxID=329993 RepID=UPI000985E7A3|nr:hypothetical protein [Cognaticolwellia aestuarii]